MSTDHTTMELPASGGAGSSGGRHRRPDDIRREFRWERAGLWVTAAFLSGVAVFAVMVGSETPAPKAAAKPTATAKPQAPAPARPMTGLSPVTATGTVTTRRDTTPAQAAAPRIHVRHAPTPRPARSISPRRPARHPAPDTPDTPTPPVVTTPPPSPTAEAIPPTPLPGGSMRRPV